MKLRLSHVIKRSRRGRDYFYFRSGVDSRGHGGKLRPLPGVPGTREFQTLYESLLRLHAPAVLARQPRRQQGGQGSLSWVIEQYKTKSKQWNKASPSTREVYDRHHHWLNKNYGCDLIAGLTRELVKSIRDLPDFDNKPSVADGVVSRLATLWDYAEEFCHLPEMAECKGVNPARNIKKLKDEAVESAPLWPLALCTAVEGYHNYDAVTFYHLARYTGQRRSDLVNMEWSHIDPARSAMFVAQIKTSARIWVPMPKRLLAYLDTLPRTGKYIVTSAKTGGAWLPTSVTNEFNRMTQALGFLPRDGDGKPMVDVKGNRRTYSPHGLRHLCGVELAHAGATDPQIAAVLGHSTMKQVLVYRKQADQFLLARGAQDKRDAMYEQERREAMIAAADDVACAA
jgi:integrase